MSHYVSEAFEKQQEALRDTTAAHLYPHLVPGISELERQQYRTDIYCLQRAAPFYWNTRTIELITPTLGEFNLSEIKVSRHLVFEDVAWCWFGEKAPFDIHLKFDDGKYYPMPLKAITWYYFARGSKPYLGMTAWAHRYLRPSTGLPHGKILPSVWATCFEGDTVAHVPDDDDLTFKGTYDERTNWEVDQMKKFVVAASTFLRQRVLVAEHTPVERHARKRMEKEGAKNFPTIRVIQLRKVERKKSCAEGEAKQVDWDCRWWVGGHTRQQWYPSLGEHLPVRIHPYIKGPEGKPLKPRITPIFSVTR